MKVNHEKLLRALLAKVYKMQDGDIDEILNSSEETGHETALDSILEKDATRITALKKPKEGQTFQDGYAKGKKEVLSTFEKDLKEKFELEDSEAQGVELVQEILSTKGKPGKAKDLTEDDIKRTPVYQNLEKASKKALKEKEDELNGKITEMTNSQKKRDVFSTVSKSARQILNDLNPVLPANAKVAENNVNLFLKEFEGYEYDPKDDGKILVMKDGKLLEDKHGHTVDFADMVKARAADFFEFKANNGGENAGNGAPGKDVPPKKGPDGKDLPPAFKAKTEDELFTYMSDLKNPAADRLAAQELWDKEHAPAK